MLQENEGHGCCRAYSGRRRWVRRVRTENNKKRLAKFLCSSIGNVLLFFFSSRRRHTRLTCDWSSGVLFRSPLRVHDFLAGVPLHDVWVVDLPRTRSGITLEEFSRIADTRLFTPSPVVRVLLKMRLFRSEERRVGKECRSRWSLYHLSREWYY